MDISVLVWVVPALVVGAVAGFALGRSGGRAAGHEAGLRQGRVEGRHEGEKKGDERIRAVAEAVSRGRRPAGAEEGSAEAELHRALRMGWGPREEEYQKALKEAMGRLDGFLGRAVRAPLSGATEKSDAGELRERIGRALGALDDLGFFLKKPGTETEGRDLQGLVQQVTREFAQDQAVGVRVRMDGNPARAEVNAQAFMDALYLILHNAGRFGGGGTVDVTVVTEDGRSTITVRDRGPGFSEEAFTRAFDPFYSTSADGMGLGLPHARKSIEGLGGRIELRNVPDGGAEVDLSFPTV
jgi:signal transduction histidine kinase